LVFQPALYFAFFWRADFYRNATNKNKTNGGAGKKNKRLTQDCQAGHLGRYKMWCR